MRTEHQVSAGGVVVRGPGGAREVLLASRRVRSGELVWGLPKGLIEEGEWSEDAAVREVREETGWRASVRRHLRDIEYWFVWEGTRIHKTVRFYLMEAAGEDPGGRDREMEEVAWFPLVEAAEAVGFDSEREVLEQAAQALEAS